MDIETDTFRFFIRDDKDNKRSSTWYTHHSGDSVYLYVNSLGGRMKVSFHPSGNSNDGKNSQFGLERNYREKLKKENLLVPTPSRWNRPDCSRGGILQVVKVLFPTSHLSGKVIDEKDSHEKQVGEKRKWRFSLPLAKVDEAVEISLFYSLKKPKDLEPIFIRKGFTPMFVMELPCGEYVSVVGRNVTFDPKAIPNPQNGKAVALDGLKNIDEQETNLHAILSSDPKDGEVFQLIEINGVKLNYSKE